MINKDFSHRIKKARLDKQLTQRKLAELAGLDPAQISRYEAGTNIPRDNIAAKLAEVLEVQKTWLLGGRTLEQNPTQYMSNTYRSVYSKTPQFIEYDNNQLEKYIFRISDMLNDITSQKLAFMRLEEEIHNPFSKNEIHKTTLTLKYIESHLLEIALEIDRFPGTIQHIKKSIEKYEREYLHFKQHGRLAEFYRKQQLEVFQEIAEIIPIEKSKEIFDAEEKDLGFIYQNFLEWLSHIAQDHYSVYFNENSIFLDIHRSIIKLINIAKLTKASLQTQKLLKQIEKAIVHQF